MVEAFEDAGEPPVGPETGEPGLVEVAALADVVVAVVVLTVKAAPAGAMT